MDHIEYFKLQAKNLLKDYKTRHFNEKEMIHEYEPKYFDITEIFLDFDVYDDAPGFKFTLMNAQHLIAKLAGFSKWDELLKASPAELELAHLLYDNAHKISIDEWTNWYIPSSEEMNHTKFDAETKLEIFKQVFLSEDAHRSFEMPYRIDLEQKHNTRPADLKIENQIKTTDMYDELDENEKYKAIMDHGDWGFMLDDTVECLHCGAQYKFREVQAIRHKPEFRTERDFDMLVCKNYPKCNGSIIDLMPVGKK